MNIAIIGSGNIGSGLALTFGQTAYNVILSSRNEESTQAVVAKLGKANVKASNIADAVKASEVVILATPYDAVSSLTNAADFSFEN